MPVHNYSVIGQNNARSQGPSSLRVHTRKGRCSDHLERVALRAFLVLVGKLLKRHIHDQGLVRDSGMMQGRTASASKSTARPMTLARGVVWIIVQMCRFAGLQRVPLMTDARRPKSNCFGYGSPLPGTLEARYLMNTKPRCLQKGCSVFLNSGIEGY